jgi:hypothetical protein
MVGIIPALAAAVIDGDMLRRAMTLNKGSMGFLEHEGLGTMQKLAETPQLRGEPGHERLLLSAARPGQLERLFAKLFDEAEFLSPHACARYRHTTGTTFTGSTSRATGRPSTISRPSRPRPCSAATPTGAARSGSRSTTW